MRSKQQPRPSYRWLNTKDNDEEGSPEDGSPREEDEEGAVPVGEEDGEDSRKPAQETEHDIEHSIPATFIQDPNVERDLSPRCLSRESSGAPRCPSSESAYSQQRQALAALLPGNLPAPAAMAAYLGAAAAAAQAHQRLLGGQLPLLTGRGSPPPPLLPLLTGRLPSESSPTPSPRGDDSDVLDFSTKRDDDQDDNESDSMNLGGTSENSPLDLSVGCRKRGPDEASSPPPARKTSRSSDYKSVVSPWTSPVAASHLPYFAAAVAVAGLSPKNNNVADWNGKLKHGTPTSVDATKALEKMTELSRLGGEELFRSVAQSAALGQNIPGTAAGRHSAWQSHWLNKGGEQAKDVLKCVWCKKSFPTLADMTLHMKEAKHCGVNVPVPPNQATELPPPQRQPPTSSPSASSNSTSTSAGSNKPSQNDLNLLIKETMPLPRKLVRGQDVWLGKGAEQTRQILKCMWCGQSFRSLAEMTSHMQQTQHYTNIISQEQIISWKTSDDNKGTTGPQGAGTPQGTTTANPSSHVSAVLTCKVCDQAFSSLKELSNHMVKNSHYKEHIMRSITESGGRRRQTREKRKKSLPVRKLLELERAQHEFKNGDGSIGIKPIRDLSAGSRITCEKCGEKIETAVFVEHIRQCVGGPISNNQRNLLKNALMSNNILPPDNPMMVGHLTPTSRDGRKSVNDDIPSPGSRHHRSPSSAADLSPNPKDNSSADKSSSPSVLNAIEQLIEKSFDSRSRHGSVPGIPGAPSHAPLGSNILKRLGIDESVDYTKPLVDAQTMNLLRNYHHQQQVQNYGRRERSGSESSSMSERGSSRVESLTPDRKMDPPSYVTPRTTPDTKREQTPNSDRNCNEDNVPEIKVKKEVMEEDEREEGVNLTKGSVSIKKEVDDEEENRLNNSLSNQTHDHEETHLPANLIKRRDSSASPHPRTSPQAPPPRSPSRNSVSPGSDRSATPRSTPGADRKPSGSLGALSSMFDSLSGGGAGNDSGSNSGKRGSSHPLAALQKLCDKTENHHPNHRSGQNSTSTGSATSPAAPSGPTPGAILAFSWACNDAVMTADSIMKCAFCDTPFISKGAYRHHLSKMHFVKDGVIPDPVAVKSNQQASGSALSPTSKANSGPSVGNSSSGSIPQGSRSSPQPPNFEESPHSKFLKYTELAKQLSSKYV